MSELADPAELEKFEATADKWWDEAGPLAPLHRFNVVRIAFLLDALERAETGTVRPLAGLRVLDVGCGGGVLAEPLARLGADVTGIDLVGPSIAVAREHAQSQGLSIDYRVEAAESLLDRAERFDVVIASEVIEHVADQPRFVAVLGGLTAPDGCLCLTTLNRTWRSFAEAVVGAEYVLGWLPMGTHDWRRFVRPADLAGWLRTAGFAIRRMEGAAYDARNGGFRLRADLSVNYLVAARRL